MRHTFYLAQIFHWINLTSLTSFFITLFIPELYGDLSCTLNAHSLIHLVALVRMWGPIWVYSCFGFESVNGHLKKLFQGIRQILGQLVFSVMAQQCLAFKLLNDENHTTMNFIRQYMKTTCIRITDCNETSNIERRLGSGWSQQKWGEAAFSGPVVVHSSWLISSCGDIQNFSCLPRWKGLTVKLHHQIVRTKVNDDGILQYTTLVLVLVYFYWMLYYHIYVLCCLWWGCDL